MSLEKTNKSMKRDYYDQAKHLNIDIAGNNLADIIVEVEKKEEKILEKKMDKVHLSQDQFIEILKAGAPIYHKSGSCSINQLQCGGTNYLHETTYKGIVFQTVTDHPLYFGSI